MNKSLIAILLGTAALPAHAASYSVPIPDYPIPANSFGGSASAQFSLAGFDASKGTLQSVSFALTGSTIYDITLAGSVGPTASYSVSNGTFLYLGNVNYQPYVQEDASGSASLVGNVLTVKTFGTTTNAGAITDAAALASFVGGTITSNYYLVDLPFKLNVTQNGAFAPIQSVSIASGFANGSVTYVYDDGTSTVPEPASWSLMLAGFGIAGGSLRRHRRGGRSLAAGAPR